MTIQWLSSAHLTHELLDVRCTNRRENKERKNREIAGECGSGGHSASSLLIQKHTAAGKVLGTFLSQPRTSPVPSHHPALPVWCPKPMSSCSTACLQPGAVSLWGNRLGTGGPAWSTPSPSAAVFMVGCVYEELSGFNPTKSQNFPWELLC